MKHTYLNCLALFGVGGAHPGGLQLTKAMLLNEKIAETTVILDAGCGTGQTSAYLAEQYNCKVIAVDHNKMMVDKAKKRFLTSQLPIEIAQANTEKLPFSDHTFHIVLSESVIAFTNRALTLAEFKRVLRTDGVLLAIEMVLEGQLSPEEQKQIIDFYGMAQLKTESEWVNYFREAGFNHISVEKYPLQLEEVHEENATDFQLSTDIDESWFAILEQHLHFTSIYKDILSFRLFKCSIS